MFRRIALSTLFLVIGVAGAASATPVLYSDRATFLAAVGTSVTDTYSAPGYASGDVDHTATTDVFSDIAMSAVVGETDYSSITYPNVNVVFQNPIGDPIYCAGCNGGFDLQFDTTSVTTNDGVYGVGFDSVLTTRYTAVVTLVDGLTASYVLPSSPGFFGLTSSTEIRSIAFDLPVGAPPSAGLFAIDDLTIAAAPGSPTPVPEPASLALLGTGVVACAARRKRQRDRAPNVL